MPVTIDGSNTPTAGGIGYGDGAEIAFTAAGTSGQVLTSNGVSAPTWAAIPAVNLATGVTGTLPAGNGGTGNTFFSVSGPASSVKTYTFPNENMNVGFRGVPQSGSAKTGSYTLATDDVGEFIQISTGGSIVIPTSTFSAGDAISLFNNTTGGITITCSAPTAYVAGTNTVRTSLTLATRGVATVLFITSTLCVVTGNVS